VAGHGLFTRACPSTCPGRPVSPPRTSASPGSSTA
jgi:hypothetical protein